MLKVEKIHNLILEEISSERLKAAQIYLNVDDKILMDDVYGEARQDNIYRIYSMTKIITMIAVLLLAERKKLCLDDKVSKYYPAYKNRYVFSARKERVNAINEITLQDLLNMTSGLGYPLQDGSVCGKEWCCFEEKTADRLRHNEPLTMQDMCNEAGKITGAFESGTGWKYGASADILGGIVEKVSGESLDIFLQKELFEPLQMTDTAFYIPESKIERIAQMYTRDMETKSVYPLDVTILSREDKESFTLPRTDQIRTCKPWFLSGGAGLYSTCRDYSHVLHMLLNEGKLEGVQILENQTVKFMRTPQLKGLLQKAIYSDTTAGAVLQGYSYSNLMRIMTDPSDAVNYGVCGTIGEYGWDGLPGNYCLVDPSNKMILIFMIQVREGADVAFRCKLRKLLYS